MPLTLNGTTGIAGVDGSAGTPATKGSDTDTGIVYGTNTVQIATNGTTAVTVDASQNVGIGTTSPSTYGLEVNKASGASGILVRSGSNTGGWFIAGTDAYVANNTAGTIQFWNNSAERARIDASGNLLVGTTNAAAKFVASTSTGTSLAVDASSTNDAVMRWTASGVSKALNYWTPGTDRLYFATGSTGGVYLANGGTSWTSASDERVKDIIEPIENAVSKVNSLRTVIGKYKADATNKRRAFLIAQDVQAVLPEAVDDGDENELGLQYADVIPLAIAAIKELSAKLDAAEARIAALEAK